MKVGDPEELLRENKYVLELVQSMVGLVTPNMRTVSLECREKGVLLHFVLAKESQVDREVIKDIIDYFETLQERKIELEVEVIVSDGEDVFKNLPKRRVYGRNEYIK